jgi:tripartite motif-containing protein 71
MLVLKRHFPILVLVLLCFPAIDACATGPAGKEYADKRQPERLVPVTSFKDIGGITLGEPLGVAVDFNGNAIVADGSPGRIVMFDRDGTRGLEFDRPPGNPAFYPTDLALYGFFTYAIDERQRALLRFDKDGAYRDVLVNFDQLGGTRRVSPYAVAVDTQGRIAITDIENHQILLIDSFLRLDILFGNYGSFPGQMDTPLGVSFTPGGDIIVADTGNRRIQFFSDAGEFRRVIPDREENNPLLLPRRAVIDDSDRLFVADPKAERIFVFDIGGRLLHEMIPAGADRFQPTDLEYQHDGKLYVTDALSRALYVFKVK